MALTLRRTKGVALTHDEVDANWTTGRTFDGPLLLGPDAIAWDDLLGAAVNLQRSGVGVSLNAAENTVEFLTSSNLSDYLLDTQQLSHSWNLQAVFPHIHAWQTTADAPNWLLQYRWQMMGALKVDAWTSIACNVPAFTYPGTGTFHQLFSTTAGVAPPDGAGISDCIQFRILRDNADTSLKFGALDPVNATASVISFDTHIAKDALGSRLATSKY
jgi:hypothetical protein